jgi:glycerol-3-phosphate dehydrogenase
MDEPSLEPRALEDEIEFVLETAGRFFARPPTRADVLAVFAGLRPLVRGEGKTSALSRDHVIHVDSSGLLTLTGGKWTTYRHMAEDCVDHAITLGKLPDVDCATKNLRIHGYIENSARLGDLEVYGADAEQVQALASGSSAQAAQLHPELPYIAAEIVWAARAEMARTVEDVLACHTRALFLNARAAVAMAEPAARLLAAELNRDEAWVRGEIDTFTRLAHQYMVV